MIVKLNVGGSHYVTTRRTLSRFPTSLISLSLHSGSGYKLDGELFFDRNGRLFEAILDVYRHGYVILRPDIPMAMLQKELEFFGLETANMHPSQRFDSGKVARNVHAKLQAELLQDVAVALDVLLVEAAHDGRQMRNFKLAPAAPGLIWWHTKGSQQAQFNVDVTVTRNLDAGMITELAAFVRDRYGLHKVTGSAVGLFSENRSIDFAPFFALGGREGVGIVLSCVFFTAEDS